MLYVEIRSHISGHTLKAVVLRELIDQCDEFLSFTERLEAGGLRRNFLRMEGWRLCKRCVGLEA